MKCKNIIFKSYQKEKSDCLIHTHTYVNLAASTFLIKTLDIKIKGQ